MTSLSPRSNPVRRGSPQELGDRSRHEVAEHSDREDATAQSLPPPLLAARALSCGSSSVLLSGMVDLRHVCRLSLLCRATRSSYGRRSRKACLTEGGGVPEDCRLEYWKCVLNVEKVCLCLRVCLCLGDCVTRDSTID